MDGGRRGFRHSKQVAIDVSKFLYFTSPSNTVVDWFKIMDRQAIKAYTDRLRKDGIGDSGILDKLNYLKLAVNFLLLEADLDNSARTELNKIRKRLLTWTAVVTVGDRLRKEQEKADNPVSMDSIMTLMHESTTDKYE